MLGFRLAPLLRMVWGVGVIRSFESRQKGYQVFGVFDVCFHGTAEVNMVDVGQQLIDRRVRQTGQVAKKIRLFG